MWQPSFSWGIKRENQSFSFPGVKCWTSVKNEDISFTYLPNKKI
jgi:hypothetical protein